MKKKVSKILLSKQRSRRLSAASSTTSSRGDDGDHRRRFSTSSASAAAAAANGRRGSEGSDLPAANGADTSTEHAAYSTNGLPGEHNNSHGHASLTHAAEQQEDINGHKHPLKSQLDAVRPTLDSSRPGSSAATSVNDTFEDAPEPDSQLLQLAQRVEDLGQDGGSDLPTKRRDGLHSRSLSDETITLVDRHYLNKALVHLQMAEEWSDLSNVGQLSRYGDPYLPHANGPRSKPDSKAKDPLPTNVSALPEPSILSYLSWRFAFHFPGFSRAPKQHWHRIQAFFDSMSEHNLSNTPERGEVTKRRVLALAFNRLFSTFAAVALPAKGATQPAGLDTSLRAKIDALVPPSDATRHQLWKDAGETVKRHRDVWKDWVQGLYKRDELDRTFELVKTVPKAADLPERYQLLIDWASLWIAQLIHAVFVSSDNAKDHLSLFSRIHHMIPYGLARYALKIASPAFLARTMVNLIFSEPLRSRSLFTRVLTALLNGELKAKTQLVKDFSKDLDDTEVEAALSNYVAAKPEIQDTIRAKSRNASRDIILTILETSTIKPQRLEAWQQAHREYLQAVIEGDEEALQQAGPQKYALLKRLLKAMSEKRDREEILQVVLEPNTPEMVKETVSIFYEAIGSVAAVTKLAPHINNLEDFMSDIVSTCSKAQCSRADVIRLVRRHVQSFWTFLHEIHSRDPEIMASFIDWDRSAFDFMRDGVPSTVAEGKGRLGMDDSLLLNLPQDERAEILAEVRQLAGWTKMHKVLEDIRRRVDFAQLEDNDFNVDVEEFYRQVMEADDELRQVARAQDEGSITEPDQIIEWLWYASKPKAVSTIAPVRTAVSEHARPPISLKHVRNLLPEYRQTISASLLRARSISPINA